MRGSLRSCGRFLWHFFLVVGWVGFLVWTLFFLPFGCGVRGLFFTNMLDWLVVVVGNGEVRVVLSFLGFFVCMCVIGRRNGFSAIKSPSFFLLLKYQPSGSGIKNLFVGSGD